MEKDQLGYRLWMRCRDVAAALIAGCWPGRGFADVVTRIDAARPSVQKQIVFGTLAALFVISLGAAQFGILGLCVFWLIVIWLIR
ncbi:MAG: hypothetical protein AAGK69_02240 [Pseudomonadota bacterium]